MINVQQAAPTISWADPADIVFGTALSGTQLDATASVQGTFTYSPAAGTVLGAGLEPNALGQLRTDRLNRLHRRLGHGHHQRRRVRRRRSPGQTRRISSYGTALSGTQLDATANVQGTFTYSPAAGTVLGAGRPDALGQLRTDRLNRLHRRLGHGHDQRLRKRRRRSPGRTRRISSSARR